MNSMIPKLLKVLDSWSDLMPTAGAKLHVFRNILINYLWVKSPPAFVSKSSNNRMLVTYSSISMAH